MQVYHYSVAKSQMALHGLTVDDLILDHLFNTNFDRILCICKLNCPIAMCA